MDADACEFLAGNLEIEVIPRVSEAVIHLISGDVGPFEAGVPNAVPVWMAVMLKRKHHCYVVCPNWLIVEELKKMVALENEESGLSPLPEFFFELSRILIREAHDDIKDVDQVKSMVQDIYDKREAKLRTSVITFLSQHKSSHAQLDEVQPIEVAASRATLVACRQFLPVIRNYQHSTQN